MTIGALVAGVVAYNLFYRDHSTQPLRPADAIIVLGGEHDGREDYGLQLAREGYSTSKTVLISNPDLPYHARTKWSTDLMNRICGPQPGLEVICFPPVPSTTRGEAMFTQKIAKERGWKSVIVISWRYHLVRARYIFGQCFDGDVELAAVPRDYGKSIRRWTYTTLYQYAGLTKAAILGCEK